MTVFILKSWTKIIKSSKLPTLRAHMLARLKKQTKDFLIGATFVEMSIRIRFRNVVNVLTANSLFTVGYALLVVVK